MTVFYEPTTRARSNIDAAAAAYERGKQLIQEAKDARWQELQKQYTEFRKAHTPGPLSHLERTIAAQYDVSVEDLRQWNRRSKDLVDARHDLAYQAVVNRPAMSLPEIARALGAADHTSIICAVRRYCARNGLPYPSRRRGG